MPDDDEQTQATINELSKEEEALRHKESEGTATDADRARIADIEVELDRCWDLLRQRRARRDADLDPDEAQARPEDVVEGYEQ